MSDRLYQVRFPTNILTYRTQDPFVGKREAIDILVKNVENHIKEHIEEHEIQDPQAVVSQPVEETG